MQLEPTGERMIMDQYKSSPEDYVIYLLHIATYRFAEQYTRGKQVLDYGCGSGYGSAQIADSAASVIAVDVASDAVEYARAAHQKPGLDFQQVSPDGALPFSDGAFDVVLSFQVFEHVRNTSNYLREIRRVLKPGGLLILVTPDRSTRLLPGQRPWNRWHLHEYGSAELRNLLAPVFKDVQMMGMGGRPDFINVEIKRCAKLKWMTFPMTLPVLPDSLRVGLLNILHKLRGERGGKPAETDFGFSVDDVVIGENVTPSVNLVALARNS